ncbi:hypothetical protein M409DRAFT_62592 [Zasmidium cellare ATCC 36951]|uniref:RRM domain-containing protein n=1 Tax=Zasmidium cellare ATCC 36951 TaxID=1080233 RepID=A0A6A6D0F4_ZASCE|nr:uncharacterized protein M409DRAFT_62592 [Zasmidium cellare ATCC 36951]KAF2172947.1 hypothetical protein M409DRAFT_62592 [Zasmidium cellare ATCC 36951]
MAPARKKQRLSNGSVAAVEETEEAAEIATLPAEETPAQAQEKAVQQRRSLFVRSLPASTTNETLTELFSDSYPIKHAVAVTDPATKECRGYGFVTFADAEDAAKAKEQFNGHLVDGKKIRVGVAEPRHRNGEGPAADKKKPQHEEPQAAPRLIVRNLPWSIKHPDQLSKLFLSYGKVKKAYIPKKGGGLLAGFGFVVMKGKKNAEKAIAGVNGKEVDGRTVAVDWAVEKTTYQDLEDKKEEEDGGSEVSDLDDAEDQSEGDEEDSAEDDSEADSDDESVDIKIDGKDEPQHHSEDRSSTLFIRNLPFTCANEDLEDHFEQFGSIRYARVVMDHETQRSKGTGFVCFYNKEDADACLRSAPSRMMTPANDQKTKDGKQAQPSHSILQNVDVDSTGQYTLDGRVLQVSKAVDKNEASRLTEQGVAHRNERDKDKRRLYLLSEGTISTKSKLWEQLSPSEKAMREESAKQRKKLIESNPSLHLSLTRLSVRNLPRTIDSRELKQLARDGVVGFAKDVTAGLRQRLSAEELSRGGEDMQEAERYRKQAGKGIVKQAKVVFESAGGSKISEENGAGRSRGYGFIEYHTHRNALMGLRWLNGHAVGYQVKEDNGKLSREDVQDRKKRMIVEFAIENAQVVMRRKEQEEKARKRGEAVRQGLPTDHDDTAKDVSKSAKSKGKDKGRKRKRGSEVAPSSTPATATRSDNSKGGTKQPIDDKQARRNQIIGRKRAMRKTRKGGKA